MDIAIRIPLPGGVDALRVEACTPQEPSPGQIRVRHGAIDVNFIDIYHRTGLYPLPDSRVPGVAGAGIVEAVGPGVKDLQPGIRVVYGGPPVGAYASTRLLPSAMALPLPDIVTMEAAAATFFKGLTAHMLLTRVFPVSTGTTLLIHAAAGGLGEVLVRWAKRLGAEVIGTVGSEAKADLARAAGADHVVVGRDADLVGAVTALTTDHGIDYAIDGIGGTTLARTLACVRKFGVVASIGQAAGPIPPISVEQLGTLSLSRPSVMAYAAEPQTYRAAGDAVLEVMRSGLLARIGRTYALADAASAHSDLESGRSSGGLLLTP